MANQASTVSTGQQRRVQLVLQRRRPRQLISASGANADTDAINVATVLTSLNTTSEPDPWFFDTEQSRHDSVHRVRRDLRGRCEWPRSVRRRRPDAVDLDIGETVFPSSSTDPVNGYKWCIGTLAQRQSKLQTAFVTAMDKEVSIILVPNATN